MPNNALERLKDFPLGYSPSHWWLDGYWMGTRGLLEGPRMGLDGR